MSKPWELFALSVVRLSLRGWKHSHKLNSTLLAVQSLHMTRNAGAEDDFTDSLRRAIKRDELVDRRLRREFEGKSTKDLEILFDRYLATFHAPTYGEDMDEENDRHMAQEDARDKVRVISAILKERRDLANEVYPPFTREKTPYPNKLR